MNIDRDKITEMLKNYRSYRFAVNNGIAPHDDSVPGMPFSSSYGPRAPRAFSTGTFDGSIQDVYHYGRTVRLIDAAVNEVLSDDERMVIKRKYLDQNTVTLYKISLDRDKDESTIRRWHREALRKLSIALQFVDAPEIHNVDFMFDKIS